MPHGHAAAQMLEANVGQSVFDHKQLLDDLIAGWAEEGYDPCDPVSPTKPSPNATPQCRRFLGPSPYTMKRRPLGVERPAAVVGLSTHPVRRRGMASLAATPQAASGRRKRVSLGCPQGSPGRSPGNLVPTEVNFESLGLGPPKAANRGVPSKKPFIPKGQVPCVPVCHSLLSAPPSTFPEAFSGALCAAVDLHNCPQPSGDGAV